MKVMLFSLAPALFVLFKNWWRVNSYQNLLVSDCQTSVCWLDWSGRMVGSGQIEQGNRVEEGEKLGNPRRSWKAKHYINLLEKQLFI